MSFAYLPLYTGDYLRDTRHLTPMRHGIYLLSLMYCWDTQGPMPLDEQECSGICNCRSSDEVDGLRYILQRYFVLMDDGWYNKRMSEIVAQAERVSSARSENGLKGALARREKARRGTREKKDIELSKCQASAKQVPSKSPSLAKQESESPSPSPSPSQEDTPLPPAGGESSRRTTSAEVIPPGVDTTAWVDFTAHRADIRKPLTQAAADKAANLLRTLTSEQQRACVDASVISRWTGLFAPKHDGAKNAKPTRLDEDRDIFRQLAAGAGYLGTQDADERVVLEVPYRMGQ